MVAHLPGNTEISFYTHALDFTMDAYQYKLYWMFKQVHQIDCLHVNATSFRTQ